MTFLECRIGSMRRYRSIDMESNWMVPMQHALSNVGHIREGSARSRKCKEQAAAQSAQSALSSLSLLSQEHVMCVV